VGKEPEDYRCCYVIGDIGRYLEWGESVIGVFQGINTEEFYVPYCRDLFFKMFAEIWVKLVSSDNMRVRLPLPGPISTTVSSGTRSAVFISFFNMDGLKR